MDKNACLSPPADDYYIEVHFFKHYFHVASDGISGWLEVTTRALNVCSAVFTAG